MALSKSLENYLEAILILHQKAESVRAVDLAGYMGYSKASISHAVKNLRAGRFLVVDKNGGLWLTDEGQAIAEKLYERHQFFMKQLIAAGVEPKTAEQDAHQIEHAISDISFQKLKEFVETAADRRQPL